jgi:uncharacterized protein YjbI with pentapeptide repeats
VIAKWVDRRRKLRSTRSGVTYAPRLWKVWISAPLAIAVASAFSWFLYQQVLVSSAVRGASSVEVVKTTLTLVAALGAVLTGVYAYRKQRLSEGDAARADADQLTQSYRTAAELIGHDKAAVRLAGVYAMARLADDWPKQRQQCIDVLCAYLRMPAGPDADASDTEVRATIVRTIASHLRYNAAISWVEHQFDFTGAVLRDADFNGVKFCGDHTSFTKVTFCGERTTFINASFFGKLISFDEAAFSGQLTSFFGATFFARRTSFSEVSFFAEDTDFDYASFCQEPDPFWSTVISGGAMTSFDGATFSGKRSSFERSKFSRNSTSFKGTTFSAEATSFADAIFSGEITTFAATFCGEGTDFKGARFSGETTADAATVGSSFLGSTVLWGPITSRLLPSPAAETPH